MNYAIVKNRLFFYNRTFGVLHFENAKSHIKQKKPTYKGELVTYKQIKNQRNLKRNSPVMLLYYIQFYSVNLPQ